MDNITHAFAGAAIAECALPPGAAPAIRRAFLVAGMVAATAPDFDLLYTAITEAPLGYLLHHRGHTHTLPGLVLLGGLLVAALRLWPAARQALRESRGRLLLAIGAALLSHLLMDAANSYGTHLFYPFSSAWHYGDAVFILEPWAWILLGSSLALNAKSRLFRVLAWLLTLVPAAGLAFVGLVPPAAAAALLLAAGAIAAATRHWPTRRRAAGALAATALLFLSLTALSRIAAAEVSRALAGTGSGAIVDLVLDANPGVPWCWSVLTVERQAGASEQLVSRRGTLSLLAGIFPPAGCALHQLAGGAAIPPSSASLVFVQEWRTDLAQLKARDATDCRTAAWLQFARVPYLTDDRAADLRYENPVRDNFSTLPLRAPSPDCPAHLTRWEKPRRDLLAP